ncbi:two-component system, chemotaxis family, response regulator CheY [Marinobacter daqiaonensis]|uniref:Two-component system, chemotaxis family, response regulator CheY n=1 Tax=Marinobacter daqiaonensis TaxID=650891 RepID=A0A1I6H8A9_9GAMM|nr:response regulator [Marinobacter daqiaonensis]SFR50527.1 two-component system, chemotaxis family, response regulator CheY [Marinobacter daqiaonensis]
MTNSQTQSKRIFLVDDDADVAQLLGFVLRRAGFEVRHAPGARQAMEEVTREGPPDLFILDLWMPELDGEYLLRWLREEQKLEQPILMLTGTVRPGLDEQLKAAGADAVAHKPLDIQALDSLVRGLLA